MAKKVVGPYRVIELIAMRGCTRTYLAERIFTGTQVALDLLSIDAVGPEERADQTDRFLREARIRSLVDDPRILKVLEAGVTEDGVPFIASELVERQAWDRLYRSKPLSDAAVRQVGAETARGLSVLHRHGIIHRDVKPSNILVLGDFDHPTTVRVKIGAFELAELSSDPKPTEFRLIGTPFYMAPELFQQNKATPQSDIYALGVSLYEMAIGAVPVSADRLRSMMFGGEPTSLPPPPVNPSLSETIMRCLAFDPKRRFSSTEELAEALETNLQR